MKAYKIRYDLPGASGNQEIVLAENEELALVNLEKKDVDFRNDPERRWFKVHSIKEKSLDEVKVGQLSVNELILVLKEEHL